MLSATSKQERLSWIKLLLLVVVNNKRCCCSLFAEHGGKLADDL